MQTNYGDHSFAVSNPAVWNTLTAELHNLHVTVCVLETAENVFNDKL